MTKYGQIMRKRNLTYNRSDRFIYNIMLGSACNWKCPYCIQSDYKFKQADPHVFCDKLLEHLEKTGRIDKVFAFQFWGGEPLLYYDSLKVLIDRLSIVETSAPMRISSNGSLLTKENYRVFDRDDVRFEISYHQGELSDEQWKIALRIKNLVVTSLTTHKVLDWEIYHQKWQEIADKFGRYIPWAIFPVIHAGNANSDFALTKEDVDAYFEMLHYHLKDIDNVFYRIAYNALVYGMSAKGVESIGRKCCNSHVIDIDMLGNEYMCHHDYSPSTKIGNIFETTPHIPIRVEKPQVPESCKKCFAYKICTGGCLRSKDKETECYFYRKLYTFFQVLKSEHSNKLNPNFIQFI